MQSHSIACHGVALFKSTKMKRSWLIIISLFLYYVYGAAQISVVENKQHYFPDSIPPGNYSGITWLGGDKYAVVSDNAQDDGFFIFEIKTDSVSGEILSARNLGFKSSGKPNRDDEGIAYNPFSNTIFISGEDDNIIKEYGMDGKLTGREIPSAACFKHLPANLGLEALSYNPETHTLWTCNESDSVFIQSYNDSLQSVNTYLYFLDKPEGSKSKAQWYAHGIGTICALDDGSLLLLEREFFVPHKKIGAFVNCKLYYIKPLPTLDSKLPSSTLSPQSKQLLAQWKTTLTVFGRSIANYEGMCLGPTLKDGSRVILLVADSQNQYAGVLKDWMKSLRLYRQEP